MSRAAEKLDTTQSSMSRTFARLKQEFNDPLMVRVGNQYQLTERGSVLLQQVNALLPDINRLWQSQDFDPQNAQQTLVIAGTDMDIVYVNQGIQRIQKLAPGIKIHVRHSSPRVLQEVVNGEVDIALTAFDEARSGLYRKLLTEERFVAVVGAQSQLADQELQLQDYLAHKHGMFAFAETKRGIVDATLAQLGLERDISLSLPNFAQIPPFLQSSELIFSMPQSFAQYLTQHYPIKIKPLPFAVPKVKIYLYWHQRQHQNPLQRWVREQLLA